MTDIKITRTGLTEAAKGAGVTLDQARTILESAGVKVEPEKPEPGTWHIARPDSDRLPAFVTKEGRLLVFEDGYVMENHAPDGKWPELTPARIVPVATAPVTLAEDQMREVWDEHKSDNEYAWAYYSDSRRRSWTATANAILAQYAAPAEGEPIDPNDVQAGDRVRLELDSGDEATFTVIHVNRTYVESRRNAYTRSTIRTVHLLHREES